MVSTTSTPTPTTQTTSCSSFYLLRDDSPPTSSDITDSGSSNLIVHHGLEQVYHKFCSKKVKESLSAFLPHVPAYIDEKGTPENSLRSVIDKPPIGGKELLPLSSHALSGFRLNPGPIPEQFRFMNQEPVKRKHKHKKHKSQESDTSKAQLDSTTGTIRTEPPHDSKKHKKQKKHEDGERKKKKKDKKKKKRHTPDPVPQNKGLQMGGV